LDVLTPVRCLFQTRKAGKGYVNLKRPAQKGVKGLDESQERHTGADTNVVSQPPLRLPKRTIVFQIQLLHDSENAGIAERGKKRETVRPRLSRNLGLQLHT